MLTDPGGRLWEGATGDIWRHLLTIVCGTKSITKLSLLLTITFVFMACICFTQGVWYKYGGGV